MGLRQTFRSAVIFAAVCMAFSSLDFNVDSQTAFSLDDGTLATFKAESSDRQLYLFFSSTCTHCESVIETMKEEISCNVNFNPVDQVASFTFPNIDVSLSFEPRVNVSYLKHLGISEVPAMTSIHQQSTTVLKGEKAIIDYLQKNCLPGKSEKTAEPQYNQSSNYSFPLPEADGCAVAEDCEEQTSTNSSSQAPPAAPTPES